MTDMTQWLAQAATEPPAAIAHWKAARPTPLTVGTRWDLAQISFGLACTALTQLRADGRHIGPYLMSGAERTVWFPLPLGTAYRLAGTRGVTVQPPGWELLAPSPGRYLGNRLWIVPHTVHAPTTLTTTDDLCDALDTARRRLAGKAARPPAARLTAP
ncbi:hypothetical protein ACQEVX_28230 [Streptomyces syringium]|uniref:hypothetical protein n=1 Tax=Streptomyces syringium TaxID=76729 RepID=UPI003D913CD0